MDEPRDIRPHLSGKTNGLGKIARLCDLLTLTLEQGFEPRLDVAAQADLNGDGYTDCLAGGRAGVFLAGYPPPLSTLSSCNLHSLLLSSPLPSALPVSLRLLGPVLACSPVDVRSGEKLWDFGDHAIKSDLMSVYAAQMVQVS